MSNEDEFFDGNDSIAMDKEEDYTLEDILIKEEINFKIFIQKNLRLMKKEIQKRLLH